MMGAIVIKYLCRGDRDVGAERNKIMLDMG